MHSTDLLRGRHVGVAGGGLVGCLAALHLVRHGARVTVVEKRPDLRRAAVPGGRSIAMSLSDRGFHALATVGLADAVRAGTVAKTHRCVHLPDGTHSRQEYGRDGQALHTVQRKELNALLLDAAAATGRVDLRFETVVENVDLERPALLLRPAGGDATELLACDHVLGADGMNSRVRGVLCGAGVLDDGMITLDYRYFEVGIPAAPGGGYALDPDGVHIWPRPAGLLVALPNPGGTFTGTLFFAEAADVAFHADRCPVARARAFAATFGEVAALAPGHADDLARNPASDIKSVRCRPWHVDGRVGLIGDACHAIVPFYAMGMNTGFEDCTVLDGLVEEFAGDMGRVLQAFEARRRPCTDAIGDLSLRNFTSIGRSADPAYERRWRLERRLWDLLPERWTPLYPMIHFSRRPLDAVVVADARQRAVLDGLLAAGADAADDHALLARARDLLDAAPDAPAIPS